MQNAGVVDQRVQGTDVVLGAGQEGFELPGVAHIESKPHYAITQLVCYRCTLSTIARADRHGHPGAHTRLGDGQADTASTAGDGDPRDSLRFHPIQHVRISGTRPGDISSLIGGRGYYRTAAARFSATSCCQYLLAWL